MPGPGVYRRRPPRQRSRARRWVGSTAGVNSLTVAAPVAYQTFQRRQGNKADIIISGSYSGYPTAIEASWNGGSYQTIVSSPSGASYSGKLANQAIGNGSLTVRFTNDTATSVTVANVRIGVVFVIAGQSNASGRGINNQSYTPSGGMGASLFGNDYAWKNLADKTDDSTGQVDSPSSDGGVEGSSVWPNVATYWLAATGIPIAFIPCAVGSTYVTSWAPFTNHYSRSTLYGSMAYRAANCGSYGVEAVLWWQGESDAIIQATAATYAANLASLAANIRTDLRCPMVVAKLQNSSGIPDVDEARINAGIATEWASDPNVLAGPDLSDMGSDDSYHLRTDLNLDTAGQRWANAMVAAFYTAQTVGGAGGYRPRIRTGGN